MKFVTVINAKFLCDGATLKVAKLRSLDFLGMSFFVKLVSEIMTYEEYKREITKNDA